MRSASRVKRPRRNRKLAPGRPRVHAESWTKVSVVLLDRQVSFLDHYAADLRLVLGKPVKRAEIVRALADLLEHTPQLRDQVYARLSK